MARRKSARGARAQVARSSRTDWNWIVSRFSMFIIIFLTWYGSFLFMTLRPSAIGTFLIPIFVIVVTAGILYHLLREDARA